MSNDTVVASEPLKIVVVGDVSSGKTSVLRTFTQKVFGTVGANRSTVTQEDPVRIGEISLIDTPGFQFADKICQWISEDNNSKKATIKNRLIVPMITPQIILKSIEAHINSLNESDKKILRDDQQTWETINDNNDVQAILYVANIGSDPNEDDNIQSSFRLMPFSVPVLVVCNQLQLLHPRSLEKHKSLWRDFCKTRGRQVVFYDAFKRDYNDGVQLLKTLKDLINYAYSDMPEKAEIYSQKIDDTITSIRDKEFGDLKSSYRAIFYHLDDLSRILIHFFDVDQSVLELKKTELIKKFKTILQEREKDFFQTILLLWGFEDKDNQVMINLVDNCAFNIDSRELEQLISVERQWYDSRKNMKDRLLDILHRKNNPFKVTIRMNKGYGRFDKNKTYVPGLLDKFLWRSFNFVEAVRSRGIATTSTLYQWIVNDKPEDQKEEENKIVISDSAIPDLRWKDPKLEEKMLEKTGWKE